MYIYFGWFDLVHTVEKYCGRENVSGMQKEYLIQFGTIRVIEHGGDSL